MGVPVGESVTVPRGDARRRDSSRFHTAGLATDPNKGTVVGVGDLDPHWVSAHFVSKQTTYERLKGSCRCWHGDMPNIVDQR
jgi:hypothetical protein